VATTRPKQYRKFRFSCILFARRHK